MRINAYHQFLNFTAGKTKILSDFDGTYMPKEFNHDVICNDNPPVNQDAFRGYFGEVQDFFDKQNKNEKKTELTISTGRNLPEFNYYMKKIKEKGLRIPIPDKLIVTNGGDEYISKGEDYFTSSRKDMFTDEDINVAKRKPLEKYVISYDPEAAVKFVKDSLQKLKGKPAILEPGTHQGMYGYKDGLTLQEQVQSSGITDYVSMRKDGYYQIRIAAPVGSYHWNELREIPDALREQGYQIDVKMDNFDDETCINSRYRTEDWQKGPSMGIKPSTKGTVKVLDKFHHAKLAADEIMKNDSNDLVIVCGDGRNDLDMLNLSHYIDEIPYRTDFSDPQFKDKVDKLPVVSIFVKNNHSNDDIIYKFESDLNFDGVRRFIIVDKEDPSKPNTLLEAIKIAQQEYAKRNPEYKKGLES